MPGERKQNASEKGDKKKGDKKDGASKKDKKGKTRGGGGTVGYTVKAVKGHYYNVVDSLDGLICPPVPQSQLTGPSRAPREPPCCPPSTCYYPPPCCSQQPGRRCC